VFLAFLVAAPVAYFAMRHWLQEFAFRIALGPGAFLLAGALAMLAAWLTVGVQSLRAALTNPAVALRYE